VVAAVPSAGGPAVVPLQQLEKQAIQHALTHTKGDRTLASQLLGIGRTTLYRKLKEYGLETVDGTLVSCIDGTRGI
jgi:DNA-binding NtrC family response regulator